MKITFILPRYDPKPVGGFKVVYEYANQLVARGHEVVIVHPHRLDRIWPSRLVTATRRLVKRVKPRPDLRLIPAVPWHQIDSRVRMLQVPDPAALHIPDGDVVFATYWVLAEYVKNYPSRKGTKFYLIQAFEEAWAGPKAKVNAIWLAPLYKIVVSRGLYEHGLELGVHEDEMIYIPDGIDHAKYTLISPIERRPPQIAMLYHPLFVKGATDGIEALQLARKMYPALRAILFGITPRPASLPNWIEYYCNPSQEYLINHIYNGSSIYLCPSWSEGFGLPLAEAMSCGSAVVSTNTAGIREFAENGVTALLSPVKQPKALADNLLRLLTDDQLRIKLARAGYERIQTFTWDRSTDLLESFINSKINQPSTA